MSEPYLIRPDARQVPMSGGLWQPDVYRMASIVGYAVGAWRVVDVGCGDCVKWDDLSPRFEVEGLDILPNEYRPEAYSKRVSYWDAQGAEPFDARDAVVVCADVMEHLQYPEVFLGHLSNSGYLGAVISTPDRIGTYGHDHRGPPANPQHVREWSMPEFTELLKDFDPLMLLTRSESGHSRYHTIMAVIT